MSAIPPSVQAVLDLFSSELASIRFGDVDAESLAALGATVHSLSAEVAAAEASLAAARSRLQEQQDMLLLHVQRVLAYAKVYAESDAALSGRLDAIALPRSARRPRSDAASSSAPIETPPMERRPRGRPRKNVTAQPLLEGVADGTA